MCLVVQTRELCILLTLSAHLHVINVQILSIKSQKYIFLFHLLFSILTTIFLFQATIISPLDS